MAFSEMNQGYLADMMMREINYATPLIAKKTHVKNNQIFIVTSMRSVYDIMVNVIDDKITDAFHLTPELYENNSWAKIKIGRGHFSGFQEFSGHDIISLRNVTNQSIGPARENYSEMGDMTLQTGYPLTTESFSFDQSLNNILETRHDIRCIDGLELAGLLKQLNVQIKEKSKGEIKRVHSTLFCTLEEAVTCNSGGAVVGEIIPRSVLYVSLQGYSKRIPYKTIQTSKRERFPVNWQIRMGVSGGPGFLYDFFDSGAKGVSIEDLVEDISKRSVDYMRNARPITDFNFRPDKPIKAVLSPITAGILAHETLGHHGELDLEEEEYSARFFTDLIGKRVSELEDFSVRFEPAYKPLNKYAPYGFYFYDWEGVKAGVAHVIKDGVCMDMLNDLSHANLYNVTPNGHSRVDQIRMSNLVINDAKGVNPDELFEAVAGKGFYIHESLGGVTESTTKQATVSIEQLYFVNKDKSLTPIACIAPGSSPQRPLAFNEFLISTRTQDTLRNVGAVGKDASNSYSPLRLPFFGTGYCGKDYQYVPVSEGGAYLLLNELFITRNESLLKRTVLEPFPTWKTPAKKVARKVA